MRKKQVSHWKFLELWFGEEWEIKAEENKNLPLPLASIPSTPIVALLP
jgi:hypothetical protein